MNKIKDLILPITTLAGMIIGVGFFSLPYITLQVGLPAILISFLVLGIIVINIHLIFGELSLNTPDFKRIPGFVEYYLGREGKLISLFSSIFWGIGGILAYLIVGGSFLENLLSNSLNWNNHTFTLIYFFIGALFIYFGINAVSKLSFWALGFLFLVFIIMFYKSNSLIDTSNLFLGSINNLEDLFLPYGAILYSLWGATLIPNIEEMLHEKKQLLRRVIIIASILPIIVYLCFIYLVLGLTGVNTSSTALIGLESQIGPEIANLALILGLLTTFTSFVSSGLVLKNILSYDLKINKNLSWFLTCFIPLIFFLFGFKNFISIINLLGGLGLGINGILILLMYKKLKEKRKEKTPLIVYPFIIVFIFGILYELVNFIN
jgi:amino acid permease